MEYYSWKQELVYYKNVDGSKIFVRWMEIFKHTHADHALYRFFTQVILFLWVLHQSCVLVSQCYHFKKKGNNLLLNWDKMKWFKSNCLYYLFTTYNLLRIWYFCSTIKHLLTYWIFTIWRNQFRLFLPLQELQVEIWYEMFIFK